MSTPETPTHELLMHFDGAWQDANEGQRRDSVSLPPVDRGKAAFTFLAACFLLETVVWGFPFAFGVYQVYYENHEPFASQGGSAIIGTTTYGVMYFMSPFVAIPIWRWPQYRRHLMYSGIIIMVLGLVAASFCNTINTLILTQGIMYSIGGVSVYFPAMGLISEWFVQRRGVAFGIMWCGTGLSGTVMPFLLQWLLDSYGYRTTLRVSAIVLVLITTPCVYLIKPRVPVTSATAFRRFELKFVKGPQFWVFLVGSILQSLGYFLPTLYLPSFALSIGLPSFAGPLAIALTNLGFCFGAVLVGYLVDRFDVAVPITMCTIGSIFSVFVFWGFATSQAMLYIFALTFGCFAAAFPCTWSGCAKYMQQFEKNGNVDAALVVSLMVAGKGIGAVISGPLSQELLNIDTWKDHASFAYGSGYGVMLVFTGVSALMGGISCVARLCRMV